MRLHRFYIKQTIPQVGEFVISDENLLNQWRNVLRMDAGDQLIMFDGSGDEVFCEFASLEKRLATLKIVERKAGLKPTRDVTLFMALIKKDNLELVLEKATELGVTRIVPVECARSEKKGINVERSQKILREAAEQSGRVILPVFDDMVRVQDIFKKYSQTIIVLEPHGETSAREYFTINNTASIGLIVGPEGGFTKEEVEFFEKNDAPIVTTGSTILRAETAAIVALTLALTI